MSSSDERQKVVWPIGRGVDLVSEADEGEGCCQSALTLQDEKELNRLLEVLATLHCTGLCSFSSERPPQQEKERE